MSSFHHGERPILDFVVQIISPRYLFDDIKRIICSPHGYRNIQGETTESPHVVGGNFEDTCIVHGFNSANVPILGLHHAFTSAMSD